MDRDELVATLRELDGQLTAACDVILVGGAAMILHFGAERATRDIDALLLRGNTADLRRGIERVASRRGLPPNWMSDAVKGFADILPADFEQRLVELRFGFRQLRLYVLGLPDQIAMKAVALREQDLEDLDLLLAALSDEDKRTLIDIMHHVASVRGDWAQRIYYFLLEQGWQID